MHIITPIEKDRITLCYVFSAFIALSCKKSILKNPHQILKRTSTVARMIQVHSPVFPTGYRGPEEQEERNVPTF